MKKFALLFLLPALMLNSCKKNTSSPSIVGAWKIANITGTVVSQSSSTVPAVTTTYTYAQPILAESDSFMVTQITVNDETWQFNSDGTFSIDENYHDNMSTIATTHLLSGWWDYTGNTTPNSSIVLRCTGTPTLVPTGGTFVIKSVTNSTLVLTVYEASVYSAGATLTHNFELTFSRG